MREFFDQQFSFNAALPHTVRSLLFHPGLLTKDWLDGRRQRYLQPFRLFLLALAVLLGVVFTAHVRPSALLGQGAVDAFRRGLEAASGPIYWGPDLGEFTAANGQTAFDGAREATARTTLTWALVVLVPLLALVLRFLNRGWSPYYVDHLVFAGHFGAFLLLLSTAVWVVLAVGGWLLESATTLTLLSLALAAAVVPVYLCLALSRVYGQTVLRSLASTMILGAVALPFAVLVLLAAGWTDANSRGTAQSERAYAYYRHADSLREAGDTAGGLSVASATVREFHNIPYGSTNLHDLFHLAEVQLWLGQSTAGLLTIEEALSRDPDHLLLLGLSAKAAAQEGRDSLANEYIRRFRSAWTEPLDMNRWGYGNHSEFLEEFRVAASIERRQGLP